MTRGLWVESLKMETNLTPRLFRNWKGLKLFRLPRETVIQWHSQTMALSTAGVCLG